MSLLMKITLAIYIVSNSVIAQEVKWYTEDYPPFNFQEDMQIKGIAIDILRAAYKELGWNLNENQIFLVPWARAYHMLQVEESACVFSITYTEERAQNFNLIGPVMPNTVAIIGRKNSTTDVKQIETDDTLRFGVVKNDIGHLLLEEFGIDNKQFVYLKSGYELVKMLEFKRVDLIAYGDIIARYQFKKANINPDNYRVIKPLLDSFLGFACNKKMSQNFTLTLDKAVKDIVKNHPELIR